jgi:hypothetical protein
MEAFNRLVKLLEPNQKDFVPAPIMQSITSPDSKFKDVIDQSLSSAIQKWDPNLQIEPMGTKYSLYTSFLYLVSADYQKANLTGHKNIVINQLIEFLISQIDLNMRIKKLLKESSIRKNQLIDQIKNEKYQSSRVIYYLSAVFNLNIIVMTANGSGLEIFIGDSDNDTYDYYNPHIILYRDDNGQYYPITDQSSMNLLSYHDNPIVEKMVNNSTRQIFGRKNIPK